MTGQTGRIARRRATHVVSSLLASVMAWSMTVAGARGQTSEIDAIVTLDDGSEHRHRQITRAYHIIEDIRAAEARAKDGITVQQSDRLADMNSRSRSRRPCGGTRMCELSMWWSLSPKESSP